MKICKKFWAMKFFGKIIVPLALASGASSVYAERSGAFVGAEIGIGGGKQNLATTNAKTQTRQNLNATTLSKGAKG